MNLDLNLLVVFDALMAEQNVTRAAERLNMSQPGVSHALTRLRLHAADPLFVRTASGMEPTERALALHANIHEGITTIQRAMETKHAFEPASAKQNFRILVSDLGEVVYIPKLMRAIASVAPHVTLTTVQMPRTRYLECLESGEADLALGDNPFLSTNIYKQRLFQDDYVCLVSTSHPRIGRLLTIKHLTEELHVVVIPSGTKAATYERAFRENRVKQKVAVRMGAYLSVPVMVSETDFIAIVPRLLYKTLPLARIKAMKLPFDVGLLTLNQYWHTRRHADVSNRWLRSLIAKVLGHNAAEL